LSARAGELDDQIVLINDDGTARTNGEFLASVTKSYAQQLVAPESMSVQVFGNTAISTGVFRAIWKMSCCNGGTRTDSEAGPLAFERQSGWVWRVTGSRRGEVITLLAASDHSRALRVSGWLATDPDAPPALRLLRHELVGKGRRHDSEDKL
jgi:hypothetical protein